MIAQAPIINAIGRIGAWANLPGGIGPLLLVGHPLKTINILTLLMVMIVLMMKLRKPQLNVAKNDNNKVDDGKQ
jgi:hypothetical protein